MLGQLIWKDLRVCRFPLIAGVALIIAAYMIAYLAIYDENQLGAAANWQTIWAMRVQFGGFLSVILGLVAVTMLAGSLIASERAEKTSRFLETLPIAKSRLLSSKVIVLAAFAVMLAMFAWCGIALFRWLGDQPFSFKLESELLPILASGTAAIGVSWCAASRLESPAFAVGIGIAVPVLLLLTLTWLVRNVDIVDPDDYSLCWQAIGCGCGLAGFVVGSIYFVRRLEY